MRTGNSGAIEINVDKIRISEHYNLNTKHIDYHNKKYAEPLE